MDKSLPFCCFRTDKFCYCASKLQRLIGCRISCATLILWRSLFLLWTNLKLYSKRSLAGKVYRVVCCSFFLEYRYCKSIKEFWYISATWHTTPVGPVEMVCYSWNYWNKSLDARVNMMNVRISLHTNLMKHFQVDLSIGHKRGQQLCFFYSWVYEDGYMLLFYKCDVIFLQHN